VLQHCHSSTCQKGAKHCKAIRSLVGRMHTALHCAVLSTCLAPFWQVHERRLGALATSWTSARSARLLHGAADSRMIAAQLCALSGSHAAAAGLWWLCCHGPLQMVCYAPAVFIVEHQVLGVLCTFAAAAVHMRPAGGSL
jgi:hypothetical protein